VSSLLGRANSANSRTTSAMEPPGGRPPSCDQFEPDYGANRKQPLAALCAGAGARSAPMPMSHNYAGAPRRLPPPRTGRVGAHSPAPAHGGGLGRGSLAKQPAFVPSFVHRMQSARFAVWDFNPSLPSGSPAGTERSAGFCSPSETSGDSVRFSTPRGETRPSHSMSPLMVPDGRRRVHLR